MAASASTSHGDATPLPRVRLLHVEDDRISAMLFAQMLADAPHYELRSAEDGAEALQQALRWLPDVLVLDAHLPDMSGVELLGRLRRIAGLEQVPAFMCSADALPEDAAAALAAGFAGYWVKPIEARRVTAELATLAGPPHSARLAAR